MKVRAQKSNSTYNISYHSYNFSKDRNYNLSQISSDNYLGLVLRTSSTIKRFQKLTIRNGLVDQSFVLQRVLVFSPSFWLSDSIPTLNFYSILEAFTSSFLEPIFFLSFGKFLEFYFRNGSIFFTVITTSPKTSLVSRIYFGNSLR